MTRSRCAVLPALAAAWAVLSGPAVAQPVEAPAGAPVFVGDRPAAATRIVRRFTFDTSPDSPIGLPDGWVRAQHDPEVPRIRPGFPIWNEAVVDLSGPGFSGAGAVRLPTRGGSTSLLLDPGEIPVLPTAGYLVAGQVRTRNLGHARAQLVVRLLDQHGAPIDGGEARSPALAARDGWTPIAAAIAADDERAAFLQVELLLLQPREFERTPMVPADLHAWPADYEGSVWFDEITVLQMPSVHIGTREASNLLAAAEAPALDLRVRDLAGEALTAELLVQDARGAVVARETRRAGVGHLAETWTPALPGFGWYRAICRVRNGAGLIGADVLDFAWLPPRPSRLGNVPVGIEQRRQVGLAPGALEDAALPTLVRAVDAVGVGYTAVPLLAPSAEVAALPDRVLLVRQTVDALAARAVDHAVMVAEVPEEVSRAAQLERGDVLGLLAGGESIWGPALLDAFGQLGQVARRWHLGAAAVSRRPDLAGAIDAADRALSRLVSAPVFALPWPSADGFDAVLTSPQRVTVDRLAAAYGAEAIEQRVFAWAGATRSARASALPTDDPPELHLELLAGDPERRGVTPRQRAASVLREAFDAWETATRAIGPARSDEDVPLRIVLAAPWTEDPAPIGGAARGVLRPSAELAAWRTLADALVARRLSATPLEITPEVRAVMLEPAADEGTVSSVLVLWQRAPTPSPVTVEMLLSAGPVERIDLFGNRTPLHAMTLDERNARAHRVELSDEPVLIEGVDPALVRFQASVRLDPPVLISRHAEHRHDLVMSNPWPITLRGHYFIVEPGGGTGLRSVADRRWKLTPRHGQFTTLRGETTRAPIDILFSAAEEAGDKELVVDVDLAASKEYGRVRIRRRIELGLPGVEFDVSYRRGPGPGGPDVFVEARVLNTGESPITASLRAHAPGFPRDESAVSDLGPEQAAVRIFPFKDGVSKLAGSRVSVALVLAEGEGRLTQSIEIPASGP